MDNDETQRQHPIAESSDKEAHDANEVKDGHALTEDKGNEAEN